MDSISEFIYLAIAIIVVAIPLLLFFQYPIGIAFAVLVLSGHLLLLFCDRVALFFKERREKKELEDGNDGDIGEEKRKAEERKRVRVSKMDSFLLDSDEKR